MQSNPSTCILCCSVYSVNKVIIYPPIWPFSLICLRSSCSRRNTASQTSFSTSPTEEPRRFPTADRIQYLQRVLGLPQDLRTRCPNHLKTFYCQEEAALLRALVDVQASQPISMATPHHPQEKPYFGTLYQPYYPLSQ